MLTALIAVVTMVATIDGGRPVAAPATVGMSAKRLRRGRSGAWNADSAVRRRGRREGRDRNPPLASGTGIPYHASEAKHYSFLE
jgi:hypothetical protein